MERHIEKAVICTLLCGCIFSFISCGSRSRQTKSAAQDFPFIKVPAMMTEPGQIAEYMAGRFWAPYCDSAAVWTRDTLYVGGIWRDDFVAAYRQWATLLWMLNPLIAQKSVEQNLRYFQALHDSIPDTGAYPLFLDLCEEYFYGVNSTFRNEQLYLPVVRLRVKEMRKDSVLHDKYAKQLECCSLNQIGTVASDFDFTDKRGRRGSLHKIRAPYTLLFFSNPGCNACKQIIDKLNASQKVAELTGKGRLAVLNVYIDENPDEWYKYMPIYPDSWTNAYDEDLEIRTNTLYDVRAIPSLYLLDADKKVIFKDLPDNRLIDLLEML
ncbi:MAG: DUF5106 domain-containing protein [Bacteroidales bacterium]|nr:DUF5106 domain-containing protein [Bacteroidales bacterium]